MNKYNIFDSFNTSLRIALLNGIYIMHDESWEEEKTKTEYVMWCITKGEIIITVDKQIFSAHKGDVVLFLPGIRYTASASGGGCEFMYQKFIIELGNNINVLGDINIAGIISNQEIKKSTDLYISRLLKLYNSKLYYSLQSHSLFLGFFTECIENIRKYGFTEFCKSNTHAHSDIWKAMSYIGEYFYEDISVSKLAKSIHMSEKHFIHSFKQTVGISPKQFIIQCRMRRASDMLINTDTSVSDIASELGYNDIYCFSRAFKNYFEVSPAMYRKNFIK